MKTKNVIGPAIIFLIIFFSFFKLYGTVNPLSNLMKEIEHNRFINAIGIDKINSNNKSKVTISFPEYNFGSEDNKSVKSTNGILSAEGKTVFDAHRNLSLLSSEYLQYGHTDYILLGENSARDDISNALEFQMRDYERGWQADVVIIKDVTVEQFLLNAYKKKDTVSAQIKGIGKMAERLSITDEVKLYEIFDNLNKKNTSFCIPYLTINNEKIDAEETSEEKISMGGLAVIKDKKLYSFLDKGLSRGVNWIRNKIGSYSIVVEISPQQNSSLEVLHSHSKIRTFFDNDIPVAEIDIKVESQINELGEIKNTSMDELIKELEKKQAEYVKKEAESALIYSQENEVDILGIGDSFFHQHPLKWKNIEGIWSSAFPQMKIKIHIESIVRTSGTLRGTLIEGREK